MSRSATITATVTSNGKSGTDTAVVTQSGDTYTDTGGEVSYHAWTGGAITIENVNTKLSAGADSRTVTIQP